MGFNSGFKGLSSFSVLTGMRGETKHDDPVHYGALYSTIHYSYLTSLYYSTTVARQTYKSYVYYNLALDY
jgi:hypothetical protein